MASTRPSTGSTVARSSATSSRWTPDPHGAHPRGGSGREHRRRAAICLALPSRGLCREPRRGPCARGKPGGEERHGADPRQLAHGGARQAADVPGHRHGADLHEGRHGRAGGDAPLHAGDRRRGGAPRLARRGQSAPRLDRGGSDLRAAQHPRQHAGNAPCRAGRRRDDRGPCRGQGRRLREQGEVRGARAVGRYRRLGRPHGRDLGAGWCPPGILGIGVGGSPRRRCCSPSSRCLRPSTCRS